MKIRVLHVDTERGWRGGERQAFWLAVALERAGHHSVFAARRGEPLHGRAIEAGFPAVDCKPVSEVDLAAAWRLRRAMRTHAIDVIHAHTAHAVAVAALAAVGTKVPLVVSRRVDFKLRSNAGTRWKYGRAAAIVAISQAVARVLAEGGIDSAKVTVVPDGVDLSRTVERASHETLAALGVAPNAPLVVQVAQLVGHKDPVNFVRAVAHLRARVPDVQALLVGDGVLRDDVHREVEALDLRGVLHTPGYRTDADALLAAADVACLSSREEGMGSVLLDALAFGKPIAATRAGGIPEVVVDGESGLLVPTNDPRALGNAIARLLKDRAFADRVAANALARAQAFSADRMAERTLAVYERVLAVRRRTSSTNAASSASVTGAP